jgi:preprotein translocase subunit SecD
VSRTEPAPDPAPGEPPAADTVRCDTCRAEVMAGTFCESCGVPLRPSRRGWLALVPVAVVMVSAIVAALLVRDDTATSPAVRRDRVAATVEIPDAAAPRPTVRVTYRMPASAAGPGRVDTVEAVARRLSHLGVPLRGLATVGRQLHLELPGELADAAGDLGRRGVLEVRRVTGTRPGPCPRPVPARTACSADGTLAYTLDDRVLWGSIDVARADADPGAHGDHVLDVLLRPAGAQRFARDSAGLVGSQLALVLDGTVLSAPTLQAPITNGRVEVVGGFSRAQASVLAAVLASPPLPVGLELVSVR